MFKRYLSAARRVAAFILVLACLTGASLADDRPVIYRAVTVGESRMLTEPGDWGETVIYVKKGKHVDILEVLPNFLYIRAENHEGYIYRSRVKDVKAVDPVNTPPYGVVVYTCMAKADGDAPVLAAPDAYANTLIILHDGARLGIIGFEDGWAKVLYKRQYGYLRASCLRDIVMVKSTPDDSALKAPLAVYTTYYKTDDTEANQGRIMNIKTASAKLSSITLYPGQKLDYNADIGPYSGENGYHVAPVLTSGKLKLNYGGGTCQVSSTLYNVLLQLPGITVLKRRAHGANGASYLPHGVDAAVGNSALNLIYRNDYDFPIRVDASAQDGALYMSMWREDDLEEELELRRLASPQAWDEEDGLPAEAAVETQDFEPEYAEPEDAGDASISEDDLPPPDDDGEGTRGFRFR